MSVVRVLIADDDVAHRGALAQYLRLSGYEVVECGDGAEALQRLPQVSPDLLLLDVDMPRLDGFAVIERVRKIDRFASLPVLFLTGMGRRNAKVRGLELGADDYILKPFDRAELLARIRAALRRAARAQPQGGALRGDLDQLGLDALVQTLDLARRSARLVLEEVGGEITLEAGAFAGCRFGRFSGHDALARLLWAAHGRFRVDLPEAAPGSSSHGTPMSLQEAMLRAASELDEARRALASHDEGAWVEAPEGPADHEALERLRPLFPLTLRDLLLMMDGSLSENARWIARALGTGRLRSSPR